MDRAPTRRELMANGMAAGGGALAAGLLASNAVRAASSAPPAQVEARAVTHALQIEQLLVIAYRQVLGTSVLEPAVRAQLEAVLGQEVQHVRLLQHALTARGEIVPSPPDLPDAQAALASHQVHWSLTRLRNQHDCLKLLVDVESLAEGAYFQGVEMIQEAGLVRTCAEILGCEAQHWTLLSGLLNHHDATKSVPYPFVEGTP